MKRNDQRIYWDYAATWWDGSQRPERLLASLVHPRLAYFDRITPAWEDVKVLDLGCGGGFMSEAWARRGARVVGVDPCAALIEVAHQHAQAAKLEIAYLAGTGESLPLEADSIDRVVCVDVLEHVQNIGKVLAEIRRVLCSDGIFFFDTINRNWLARLVVVTFAENIFRMIRRGIHDPEKFIRPAEMRFLLEQHGFTLDSGRFVGMGPVGLNRRLDFVIGLLPITAVMYLGYAIAK
jgi:2-polyprenyl-6-hydroxyphenyl methylase / 3-demethylubiquinone-9 3-methyltransferase